MAGIGLRIGPGALLTQIPTFLCSIKSVTIALPSKGKVGYMSFGRETDLPLSPKLEMPHQPLLEQSGFHVKNGSGIVI